MLPFKKYFYRLSHLLLVALSKPILLTTTVKDIKEQAQSIKEGGLKGSKAWERLQNYMRTFDNVFEMWGELSVQRGQSYTPLSKIVKSDFFFN
jgi:hypothetical protein